MKTQNIKPLSAMLAFALFSFAGCMNAEKASKQIECCPEYMRENIGPVVFETTVFSPFVKGYVLPKDPSNRIHLLPLADDNTILEEAFHSFELRAGKERYKEWERFYHAFHNDETTYKDYGGLVTSAAIMSVPLLDIMPVGGYANFRATVSHFEDTAGSFVYMMNHDKVRDPKLAHKCEVVMKFATGGFRDESVE